MAALRTYNLAMSSRGEERREFQRLLLSPPIPGTLGATAVSIVEIGVLGARVHHAAPLETARGELRFAWNDGDVGMKCEVVRTSRTSEHYPDSGLQSGLRFAAAIGDSGDRLRDMLAALVTKALQERRDGSLAMLAPQPIDGDKTVRGRGAAFLCYRLENRVWHRRRVFLPEQPSTGFTVARSEENSEIQRLCEVDQASDDGGRRLIRLFAELSVSDALEIPPRA